MKRLFGFIILIALVACGNPNNDQTKIEEATADIDTKQFTAAISILSSMDQTNPVVATLLSSAYAGRAGFDALHLLDLITLYVKDPARLLIDFNADNSTQNLSDIEQASSLLLNLENNPNRIQFASIEIYKVSQLLLLNYNRSKTWNPCFDSGLAANDIVTMIVSINLAAQKIQNTSAGSLSTYITSLGGSLAINPLLLNASDVANEDILNFRNEIVDELNKTFNLSISACN